MKQHLFFIAIILPAEICDAITEFKREVADRFQSKAALKLVPHITLKAPFKLLPADSVGVISWFETMPVTIQPFEQKLQDFGAFHNKYNPVIFVKPVMSPDLRQLQKQVLQNFRTAYPEEIIKKQEFVFNPHVTIAYRDLQHTMFIEAWEEYREKKYAAGFRVSSFQLLQHDGKMWNVISNFSLPLSVQ